MTGVGDVSGVTGVSGVTYRQALSLGLMDSMSFDPSILCLGVGVADGTGIFGTTREAHDSYPSRVLETPISESSLTGALLGLALEGWKPMLVHARMDFLPLTMEHLVNTLAKWSYLHSDHLPPIAIRCVVGRGRGQGPTHSQDLSAILSHVPGLRVLMPYRPLDAYYAVRYALTTPGVNILMDYRRLYDDKGEIPLRGKFFFWGQGFYETYWSGGTKLFILGFGDALRECHEAAKRLHSRGVQVRVADLQTAPIKGDHTLVQQAKEWGRCIAVSSGHRSCGLASDFASYVPGCEIVTPPDTPCPASPYLEADWYPSTADVLTAAGRLLGIDCALPEKKLQVLEGSF